MNHIFYSINVLHKKKINIIRNISRKMTHDPKNSSSSHKACLYPLQMSKKPLSKFVIAEEQCSRTFKSILDSQ